VDVTKDSGIIIAQNTGVGGTNPHAVAVEDFDGDGKPDVIITTFGAPHVRYFRNPGDLHFQDVTKGSGLESFAGGGTGAARCCDWSDVDGDGWPGLSVPSPTVATACSARTAKALFLLFPTLPASTCPAGSAARTRPVQELGRRQVQGCS
jgi:hypothetical protein